MSRSTLFACASTMLFLGAICCRTSPSTAEGRSELQSRSTNTLNEAKRVDGTISSLVDSAAGVAVFPRIGKGAAGVGGAYGKGTVYEDGRLVGYCDMTQATAGAQLGAQTYSEIVVFKTREALDHFKRGALTFDAQATAVAVRNGAAANANYSKGVAVFTMDEAGLMFEAAVGGQKFSYETI